MIEPALFAMALVLQALPGGDTPPSGAALVDRLIAVLPESGRLNWIDRSADAGELARLVALNPTRGDAIRPVLEAHRACESGVGNAATERVLRGIAERLGDARLTRLIQFYEGEDLRVFEALKAREAGAGELNDADRAELERIMSTYPLRDFYQGFGSAFSTLGSDPDFLAALGRCASEKSAALARLDLRHQ